MIKSFVRKFSSVNSISLLDLSAADISLGGGKKIKKHVDLANALRINGVLKTDRIIRSFERVDRALFLPSSTATTGVNIALGKEKDNKHGIEASQYFEPYKNKPVPSSNKKSAKEGTARSALPASLSSSSAPAETEKKATSSKPKKERVVGSGTQIVISFDTTGSMTSCLHRVKAIVGETVEKLFSSVPNLEISIVAHGDYCDEHSSYLIKKIEFTNDKNKLVDFVKNVGSTGGGDMPEAYEYVLRDVRTTLKWKDDANKSLIMIGDATPHPPTDPQNKLKIDWKEECRLYTQSFIKVYAVKCLAWSESKNFWTDLARLTNGHYVELHQFQAICDFIIAISIHEGGDEEKLGGFKNEIIKREGSLTRNYKQLFVTLGNEDPSTLEGDVADLDAVEPGRFQILDVPYDISIKDFVIQSGAKFQTGKGFYEFNKKEEVQAYKEIVLVNKRTGDMFTGEHARAKAGIPDHIKGVKVNPPPSDTWTMFVQSTSYNRKLIGGTKFLYEVEKI